MSREPAAEAASFEAIESTPALRSACRSWRRERLLALDTEFERSRTYYPRPALLQVASTTGNYLIDPLSVPDLEPFFALLRDEGIVKVMHSASEDLEIFFRMAHALPRPIFDTQVAATLSGHGHAPGYRRLVAGMLGVELPKDVTRSNWLSRPLSPAQRAYAALDVAYLPTLHERLARELARAGREAWAREEFERLLDEGRFDPDPDAAYLRVRGAGELSRRERAVLQGLCAWREREARRRDLPRGFVVRDPVLLAMARRPPRTAAELVEAGLHRREAARNAGELLALIRAALDAPESELPPSGPARVDPREHGALLARLKGIVAARAEALDLPPPFLVPRDSIEALVRAWRIEGEKVLPAELTGWRRSVIGDELVAELERGQ